MGLNVKRCVCGQAIVFVRDSLDPEKTHPLDVSSPTYALIWDDEGPRAVKQNLKLPSAILDDSAVLVSHFRTCTRVRDFAKARKDIEANEG